MTRFLPDVALSETSQTLMPLDRVGMQGIDLPILLDDRDPGFPVHAKVDLRVDLPDPGAKGIHMSRLYRLLDGIAAPAVLTPASIATLLHNMVASHADCSSTRAGITLTFSLLQRRPALETKELWGWKAYPVVLNGRLEAGKLVLDASVDITYSSTCPCSAALSRQLLGDAFTARFTDESLLKPDVVAQWLTEHGSLATPHSQRSVATVNLCLSGDAAGFGLLNLIDVVETSLGTAVQTAVKRADEQAFAKLNGSNLMYVEDAARRIQRALDEHYSTPGSVRVRHFESLHPHDAVAETCHRN